MATRGASEHPDFTDFDVRMLARAVQLARRGQGYVEPNPMVGCVIVRGSRVIGEGWHRRFGGPHAEVRAMRDAAKRRTSRDSKSNATIPRGCTVYVTLEPCCDHPEKKTPPCVDALIRANVARVVIAALDPNPHVRGKSVRRLRDAGIHVDVLGHQPNRDRQGAATKTSRTALGLIAPFATFTRANRPYVIAKWAQSLDGKLATASGDSQWISCGESRRVVHRLRARIDAILVGVNTVLTDDSLLTARDVTLRRVAARVVLDTQLRIPIGCRLVRTAHDAPLWIMTSRQAAKSTKAVRLRKLGADVIPCQTTKAQVSPTDVLRQLRDRNVMNLMVEGGPTVLTTFLQQSLVDEAMIFIAPLLIGGNFPPGPCHTPLTNSMSRAIRFADCKPTRCGSDQLFTLRFPSTW